MKHLAHRRQPQLQAITGFRLQLAQQLTLLQKVYQEVPIFGQAQMDFHQMNKTLLFYLQDAKQAGEYLVTVTVDGCTSDAYHTYVSSCIAAPVVGISKTTAVVGDTVSLTASFNPTATYSWVGPNGYVSTEQNPTIFGVTSLSTGTYTLIMTLPNGTGGGCTTPDSSVTLVVAPQKPLLNGTGVGSINGAVSSPSSTFVDTVNGTLNLSAGTIAATYQWSGPNGFTSSNQNVAISNLTKAAEGTIMCMQF